MAVEPRFSERAFSKKVCVLYDPRDGRVVHTHSVLIMPGGQEVDDQEVEDRAKDRAKRAGHNITNLSTLRVDAEECDGSSQYRVNQTTKRLEKVKNRSSSQ